jgi:hypothetical protein
MIEWIKTSIDNMLKTAEYRVTWKSDNSFEVDYWKQLDGRTLHCIATLPVEVTIGNFCDGDCGEMFYYEINKESKNDSKNESKEGVSRLRDTSKRGCLKCA